MSIDLMKLFSFALAIARFCGNYKSRAHCTGKLEIGAIYERKPIMMSIKEGIVYLAYYVGSVYFSFLVRRDRKFYIKLILKFLSSKVKIL